MPMQCLVKEYSRFSSEERDAETTRIKDLGLDPLVEEGVILLIQGAGEVEEASADAA